MLNKSEVLEKAVSRKSLLFLFGALGLLAIGGSALLFGPSGSPEPARSPRVSTETTDAKPVTATARVIPRSAAESTVNAPGASNGGPPPALPDNVKTGEEGALSPTRTGVRLYGDAKIKPLYNLHNNEIGGVQVSHITPGSFWQELGIDEGDVILELNGELIDTPAASIDLMNQFSRGYVLNVRLRTIEGRERFIDYRTPEIP
jgi:membrane-associated protease RseP (regulator of RpoE activity)